MTSALKAVLDYAAPLPPYTPNTVSQLKREFVRNTAVQAAAMAFFTGISCYYSDRRELRIEFFKQAVIMLGVSAIGRALALRVRYRAIIGRGMCRRVVSLMVDCIPSLYFALNYTVFNPMIKIGGHVLTVFLLRDPSVKLTIVAKDMQNWGVSFGESLLSPLGTLMGEACGLKLFNAAGTVASVAAIAISLMIALNNMAGELSKVFFFAASYSLIWDFLTAPSGGMYASVKAVAIAAIPIITTAAFLVYRQKVRKVSQDLLDYAAPIPPSSKDCEYTLGREFIRNTAIHALAIASMTALSCYLATTNTLRKEFIQNAATVFAFCAVARAFAAALRYIAILDQGLLARTISYGADCIAPFYFSLRFDLHRKIVHEGGHVFSTYALSKLTSMEVTAEPTHWMTKTTYTGATKFGTILGEQYSRSLFKAAGSMATVVASTVSLLASSFFNTRELSKTLFFSAAFSLIAECNYAKDALTIKSDNPLYPHHDFVFLWKEAGVHPYLAIVGMIALPVISTLGYLRYRNQGFFKKPDGPSVV
jgi:hypothetical protein